MEELVIFLFIVLIILLFSIKNSFSNQLKALTLEIRSMQDRLKFITENRSIPTPEIKKEQPPLPVSNWAPKEPVIIPQIEPEPIPPLPVLKPIPEEEPIPNPIIKPIETFSAPEPIFTTPPPPPKPDFFERNPDLEKFIGENLVSKIGIAILVIAIGFFVKFAIDNDWIGPVGRVGIGLLCGGILTGIAHRLRASYAAFSSVLIGGGLAVFYFTIALAYKDYHLFAQPVAFGIMVVITAFAVMLSLLYNRQEVAVIALVGGFCVPFIVSNGNGNYVALFTYLLLLNTGLLVIAYRKAWRLLNLLAFVFTIILFGTWLGTLPYLSPASTYRNAFLFATLFYLLFLAINIAHNVKQQKKFIASDFGIILANTSLYFGTGLYLIYAMKASHYVGLFSGAMGAFNLLLCFLLYRNKQVDKNVLYLLIGITLTFISLTIPLQLHGHFITLFWATECVLLYWLYQRSKIPLTHLTAHIIWVLMLVSLFMDWTDYVSTVAPLTIILNSGFITTLFAAVASYAMYFLHRKALLKEEPDPLSLPRQAFLIVAIGLLYAAGFIEFSVQLGTHFPGTGLKALTLLAYTYAFVLGLSTLSKRGKLESVHPFTFEGLLLFSALIYLISIPEQFSILRDLLLTKTSSRFVIHWIGAVFVGILLYQLIRSLRTSTFLKEEAATVATWIAAAVVVVFVSVELHLLMSQFFYTNESSLAEIHRVFIKAGLPIIWGLCSFAFMWLGMHHKYRPLRIVSLTLFSITLAKLFMFDIQNIPVAGKIAAFFCLGVLLLVVSFMYQRLKKIIVADEQKPVE